LKEAAANEALTEADNNNKRRRRKRKRRNSRPGPLFRMKSPSGEGCPP